MIGRAAQGRPWIFREIAHFLRHGDAPAAADGRRSARARSSRTSPTTTRSTARRRACASRASISAGIRASSPAAMRSAREVNAAGNGAAAARRGRPVLRSPRRAGERLDYRAGAAESSTRAQRSARTTRIATGRGGPRRVKKTLRMNGGNEIGHSVEKSLDEYFRRLDGEPPHGIYDMVISERRARAARLGDGSRRRQPDAGGRHARHEPQHAALQALEVRHPLDGSRVLTAPDRSPRPDRAISPSAARHDHADRPGAAVGLRQDRPRRVRARPRRARRRAAVHRRHREGARRRRPRGHRGRRLHRLSRRCSTAASRRCIPKVHGGILARRDLPAHVAALARARHPDRSISSSSISIRSARRSPSPAARSTTRSRTSTSAARRWCARRRRTGRTSASSSIPPTTPRCSPSSSANGGALSDATRFRARAEGVLAHGRLRRRDRELADRARRRRRGAPRFPDRFNLQGAKVQDLRYGENPHQQAAFYRDETPARRARIATYRQLQGKELSYNNIADADAAWECVKTFAEPACVIVKHANPCGVAIAATPLDAYRKAFATDPTSAFGGIIAFNRPVDAATLEAVAAQFVEVLIAPAYTRGRARARSRRKANVRVLEVALPRWRRRARCDIEARRRRLAGADAGRAQRRRGRSQGRHAQGADAGAARRPAVRLARRQVRQVERHRLLRATARRSASAPAR